MCRIGRKVDEILARDLGNHLGDGVRVYVIIKSWSRRVRRPMRRARMQNIPRATASRLYCYEVLLFITFYMPCRLLLYKIVNIHNKYPNPRFLPIAIKHYSQKTINFIIIIQVYSNE